VFALEVFRFDNFQHCMLAFQVLERHGIDPRPHQNPEVNIILASLDRPVRPEAEVLPIPEAPPPPPLKRDRRIKLFATTNKAMGEPEATHEIAPAASDATEHAAGCSSVAGAEDSSADASGVNPPDGVDPATSR
jgi:hypothetical protein